MKRLYQVTPEGTKDYLFHDCAARRQVTQTLSTLFSLRGYQEVMTPTLEYYDMFSSGASGIPQEMLYKTTDLRGRLLCMRPDSTMPIARLVGARLKDAVTPIRLFYSQNVFRVSPVMSGRNDEIMQSGIELIGAAGKRADLEVIVTAIEAIEAFGIHNYRIELAMPDFLRRLQQN